MAGLRAAMKLGQVVAVVAALVASMRPSRVEAASCRSYTGKLMACQDYVIGLAEEVDPRCCEEVRKLNDDTRGSTRLRREICSCFSEYLDLLDEKNVENLPNACSVDLGYPISKSTNCNTIT